MKKYFLIIVLMLVSTVAGRSQDRSRTLSRALLHSTVRIETTYTNGNFGTATGFIFEFKGTVTNAIMPVIVTCWHVVEGCSRGSFFLSLSQTNVSTVASDRIGLVFAGGEKDWIRHPDTNIDLAIMPIGGFLHQMEERVTILDIAPFDESLIATHEDLTDFGVFQELKFIGYPIGIWDEKNNLPISRRGMTATDPIVDYNGRSEFLIDAAVFPGSSGSPVLLADEDGGVRRGGFHGPQLKLLGILYAVDTFTSEGNLEIVPIPTAFDAKVRTRIPANLGIVVKASRLMDFKPVLEELAKKELAMGIRQASKPDGNPGK